MNNPVIVKVALAGQSQRSANRVVKVSLWIFEHWLTIFLVMFGLYWVTPFFAPVFMQIGWQGPANLIYTFYSTQCHQMAQRSLFLFGPQPMDNAAEFPIHFTGDAVADMLASRAFIGNANLGWKVAWSDRMVYMYGGVLLAAIIFRFLRHRRNIRPLRLRLLVLLALPMILDGGTHWLSDITGSIAEGFRYSNEWLVSLTSHVFPSWFYVGDALGSFNSWIRLISGLVFGIAVVWYSFPYLERSMSEVCVSRRETDKQISFQDTPNGV